MNLLLMDQALAHQPDSYISDVFLVQNVEVSADVGTLEDSKSEAIKRASSKAFGILAQRLAPSSLVDKATSISQDNMKDWVKKITPINERMTSHSYTALYDVLFDNVAIEAILSKSGIRYANDYASSILIVPILHSDNTYTVWKTSPWQQAWGQLPELYGLTHADVVEGNLEDIENIKPETAMNDSYDSFGVILGQYDCVRIGIVSAEQVNQNKLEVTLRLLDKNKEIIKFTIYQRIKNEADFAFYKRISLDLLAKIDNLWKGEDLFDQAILYSSRVYIHAHAPKNWNEIRKVIESINEIRNYRVVQNSSETIELELNYAVAPATLSNLMLQKGLKVDNQDGKVILSKTVKNGDAVS